MDITKRAVYISFGETDGHAIDYLIGIMKDARTTTYQRIYNLDIKELHWQYAEGWNSISCLLSHIISIDNFFRIRNIERREPTEEEEKKYMPGMTMGKYIPELITNDPIEYYIEELKASQKKMLDALTKLKEEDFIEVHHLKEWKIDNNMAWSLYHAAEDEVHHRGQISIIRKLYREAHKN